MLLPLNDGCRTYTTGSNGTGVGADKESKSLYYQKLLNELLGKKKEDVLVRKESVIKIFGDQSDWLMEMNECIFEYT